MEKTIEIVGTETIKPASPTPDHLRKFGLSVFDQLTVDMYTPLVLFYPADSEYSAVDRIRKLKHSLSEALVRFYPVAGRLVKDELYVNCDDRGVDFTEAKVNNLSLSDVLQRPDDKVIMKKLIPCSLLESGAHRLLRVQVNVFECGGIVVGLCFGHKIMDACAMSALLKGWAALARGDLELPALNLNVVASHFPAIPIASNAMAFTEQDEPCTCRIGRLVFTGAKIATLRNKAASVGAERPTRVASVSALIWMCLVNALTKKSGQETRPSVLLQTMNLRGRVEPPLSENSLGNMVGSLFADSGHYNDATDKLQGLAGELRRALKYTKENYVTKFQNPEETTAELVEGLKKCAMLIARDDIDFFMFTSWCRFGLYEADFGWGRPVWISSTINSEVKNTVVMMDTRGGDGIEVLVTLAEDEMGFFETDPKVLEFASLNPNVCP